MDKVAVSGAVDPGSIPARDAKAKRVSQKRRPFFEFMEIE